MMNKRLFILYSWLLLIVSVLAFILMVFSWVGDLYGLNIQSLLSIDGIRWLLRYSLKETQAVFPFLQLMSLAMGVGIVYYSGWFTTVFRLCNKKNKQISYKQIWAFRVSAFIGLLYLMIIIWDLFSSDSIMLSVSGTLYDSPFIDGFPLWFALLCIIVGGTFGYLTGVFHKFYHFAQSIISAVQAVIPILIIIFIILHLSLMFRYVFLL